MMEANVRPENESEDGRAPTVDGASGVDAVTASVSEMSSSGVGEAAIGAVAATSAGSPSYAEAVSASAPLPPPLPSASAAPRTPLAPIDTTAPGSLEETAEASKTKHLSFASSPTTIASLSEPEQQPTPTPPTSEPPFAPPLSRIPSRPGLPSRQSSTFTAPSWHSPNPSKRPSKASASSVPHPPKKSLVETSQDLRSFLRVFTVFFPASLRRLRSSLPAPVLRLARLITNRVAMALHKRGALASSMFYDILVYFWSSIVAIFFREIRSRGAWKIPREGEGAVIFVVGPHHNQFLDPILLLSEVRREAGRRISFLTAEKSMHRAFIGQAARLMQSIPVARAQDMATTGAGTLSLDPSDPLVVVGFGTNFVTDFAPRKQIMLGKQLGNACAEIVEVIDETHLRIKKEFKDKVAEALRVKPEGLPYKILPYVDQTRMYSSVYQKLKDGGCIGIFPEGGSHDRTDLLPLKAGVSIMALGALAANPALRLRIVPVGLSYFHPHRFRSRAVVEFGSPIEIPQGFVEDFGKGGEEKRGAIAGMMDLVVDGLKSVTIRAPDFETLMLIQATRRLYRPPGQHLTLGQIVELNKRFIAGYEVYKDEPRLKALMVRVGEYNTLLRHMGLKDHQIERVARPLWRSLILLLYRIGLFSAWGVLALPGVVLNAPIFIAATIISRRKAKEALAASTVKIKGNDVLATWKVLVALAGAPALYSVYAAGATVLAFRYELPLKYKIYAPVATMAGLPLIGYSALKFGEVGMDVYKSLRPLFLSVLPGNEKQLDHLRKLRAELQRDISLVVNEFGPQLFEDFQATRIIPPTSVPAPVSPTLTRRRSTYGPQGQNTFLTHPMSWVDEYLFGWSQSQQPRPNSHDSDGASEHGGPSGYASGYTTDEPADYDEVIHILSREQDTMSEAPSDAGQGPRYRRSSRNRSRSHLDLTALDAAVARESKGAQSHSRQNSRSNGVVTTALDESAGATKRAAAPTKDE
ncbi:hypothetical protein RQP46_002466 [Phenoliferia psychrophenolica]